MTKSQKERLMGEGGRQIRNNKRYPGKDSVYILVFFMLKVL